MDLQPGQHIYFASDFHLGLPDKSGSQERERRLVSWLTSIEDKAYKIFLVGDMFDVWFEYKNVVPKGHVRFLGKLAELTDAGISIEAFTGNHDLWMKDYFEEELNILVHHGPIERAYAGKKFLIAHGDGLGPGDRGYKILKKILRNKTSQWLYRRLHPDTGVGMAGWFSRLGPKHVDKKENLFLGPEKEWLVQYALEKLKSESIDYFIFGHRHLPINFPLPGGSRYVNLGDWLEYDTYADFDGNELLLKSNKTGEILNS